MKNKKIFRGDYVSNPFDSVEKLSYIIDNSKEISKETFLKNIDIEDFTFYGKPLKRQMRMFPNDFSFYSYKGKIYFFTHSMIENFFW